MLRPLSASLWEVSKSLAGLPIARSPDGVALGRQGQPVGFAVKSRVCCTRRRVQGLLRIRLDRHKPPVTQRERLKVRQVNLRPVGG